MLLGKMNREQIWLLPRTPDEPISADRQARFVAERFNDDLVFDDQLGEVVFRPL